jgi:hypothetical protein
LQGITSDSRDHAYQHQPQEQSHHGNSPERAICGIAAAAQGQVNTVGMG